jgi:hypothetical protein
MSIPLRGRPPRILEAERSPTPMEILSVSLLPEGRGERERR